MVRFVRRIELTRTTPIYNIGAASRLSGLPIWTLRWIEKHELVAPKRTEGNQRLYSEADVALLVMIRDLMEKKVNLAGIREILRMRLEAGAEELGAATPAARRVARSSPTAPRSGRGARRSPRARDRS